MSIKEQYKKIKWKLLGKNSQEEASRKQIENLCKHGVTVGKNCHIYGSRIDSSFGALITIGDNVTITNATVLAHDASTMKFIGNTKLGRVEIGDNVFVGFGAIILPNTTIGDNVIVGAGTVVRGNIPSDSVIAGNPWQRVGSCSEYIARQKTYLEGGEIIEDKDYIRARELLNAGKKVFVR